MIIVTFSDPEEQVVEKIKAVLAEDQEIESIPIAEGKEIVLTFWVFFTIYDLKTSKSLQSQNPQTISHCFSPLFLGCVSRFLN